MRRAILADGGDPVVSNTAHYKIYTIGGYHATAAGRRKRMRFGSLRRSVGGGGGVVPYLAVPDLHYCIRVLQYTHCIGLLLIERCVSVPEVKRNN